jgi:hypothetical protein
MWPLHSALSQHSAEQDYDASCCSLLSVELNRFAVVVSRDKVVTFMCTQTAYMTAVLARFCRYYPVRQTRVATRLRTLVACMAVPALRAQTTPTMAAIRGQVNDTAGRPIAGAEALLPGTNFRATSESDGSFLLSDIPLGRYILVVRHVGFTPVRMNATLSGPDTVAATFVLHDATTALDTVLTTAKYSSRPDLEAFETRRKIGIGHFFTQDEVAEHPGSTMSTLLRTKITGVEYYRRSCGGRAVGSAHALTMGAGLSTGNKSCVVPPACYLQLFVDGNRVYSNDHVTTPPDIDEYSLDLVQGIEVYRSGETPALYAGNGAVCGTIVLWLRR